MKAFHHHLFLPLVFFLPFVWIRQWSTKCSVICCLLGQRSMTGTYCSCVLWQNRHGFRLLSLLLWVEHFNSTTERCPIKSKVWAQSKQAHLSQFRSQPLRAIRSTSRPKSATLGSINGLHKVRVTECVSCVSAWLSHCVDSVEIIIGTQTYWVKSLWQGNEKWAINPFVMKSFPALIFDKFPSVRGTTKCFATD